ncbi:MAG: hypothetical protein WC523_03935 [Patescibacteria group bacterium]
MSYPFLTDEAVKEIRKSAKLLRKSLKGLGKRVEKDIDTGKPCGGFNNDTAFREDVLDVFVCELFK